MMGNNCGAVIGQKLNDITDIGFQINVHLCKFIQRNIQHKYHIN